MTSAALQVRRLGAGDAAAFQALRLGGLRLNPDAFGSSWEEEVDRPLERTAASLASAFVAGCEKDGVLVGIGGLRIGQSVKTRHRGGIWGVYVDPRARGLGVGKRLMAALIAQARAEVEDLTLTVSAHNEAAIALYRSLGFEPYGLDRRALKIGEDYVDELLMRLVLAG
ncbi:GNAT family N-acetyltransferase [Caulobacter sp. NIBR1757]|uniref:GNAT family N-acetyltransferase n=1 Tax=Caulobacter sp. NIBR1757 TaxID=3016000 RepID=UPI0022F0B41C|nr:GNAT family N-acetyltransferase [Caulobacter sp. NIBR1757]WGM40891.1 Mycothiol acetyltransferase [Caulobacter sp. NIBR1757]